MPVMSGMYGTVPIGLKLLFGDARIPRISETVTGATGTSVVSTAADAEEVRVELVPYKAHGEALLESPMVTVGTKSGACDTCWF